MAEQLSYDAALVEVRRLLGAGYAVVPVYPDMPMIAAALDQWDEKRGNQSYTDTYTVMVQNYVKRRGST